MMTSKNAVYINRLERQPGDFLFYMHQFAEAGLRAGFLPKQMRRSPRHLFRRVMPAVLRASHLLQTDRLRHRVLIITSRGDGILEAAYPHYLSYQIVPMLWDVWPSEQDRLFGDLRLLRCPLALVTSRQMARRIEQELGIKTLWVPEGIDTDGFIQGGELASRPIDIYELGRQHGPYHQVVRQAMSQGIVKTWKGNEYDTDGRLLRLAVSTGAGLKELLSKSRLVTCFPKSDTASPSESGGIETLTQRYWEVMLSRALPIGRAPGELTDLIGYNPVIDIDWRDPCRQLGNILANISSFQPLIERNYAAACEIAPWDKRMAAVKSFIVTNLLR